MVYSYLAVSHLHVHVQCSRCVLLLGTLASVVWEWLGEMVSSWLVIVQRWARNFDHRSAARLPCIVTGTRCQ